MLDRPNQPIIPNVSMEAENDTLASLWTECQAFLDVWKAHRFTTEDEPADAFVAVMELQQRITHRRSYILAKLEQEELPF